MELRVLNYFLAIAREQSIVHAAESLHLSQPTLSTQIKNLEKELGKQLFIRGTKGTRKVTLTEEGMILRKRAEEILDLVRRTENEITLNDDIILGDVYIGTGETDGVRLMAKAARMLQEHYPGIHYHISSGNASHVMEQLDKGLIDFGIIFGDIDLTKYNSLNTSYSDLWFGRESEELNIIATYNLLFNASLLVDEGLGYAISYDKIINTGGGSRLCFRPLAPQLESHMHVIWKKYQMFSKPAEKFLEVLREILETPQS